MAWPCPSTAMRGPHRTIMLSNHYGRGSFRDDVRYLTETIEIPLGSGNEGRCERASSKAIAMPTAEYYQTQIELLLLWASATTSRDLQVKLIERACQLLALANCADDQTLRYIEEVLESAFAKFLNRPWGVCRPASQSRNSDMPGAIQTNSSSRRRG